MTLTATQFGCDNPEYRWRIQNTLGAWQITLGLAAGTYQVGVWSKQPASTSPRDSDFISTYQIAGA